MAIYEQYASFKHHKDMFFQRKPVEQSNLQTANPVFQDAGKELEGDAVNITLWNTKDTGQTFLQKSEDSAEPSQPVIGVNDWIGGTEVVWYTVAPEL